MANGRVTIKEFKAEMMPRIENLETNVTNIHADIGKIHSCNLESAERDMEMMGAIKDLQITVETAPVMNIHTYLSKDITKKVGIASALVVSIIVGLQQAGIF